MEDDFKVKRVSLELYLNNVLGDRAFALGALDDIPKKKGLESPGLVPVGL
jgi:hypothetical protein